jgi:hypothetical protein
VVLSMGLYQIVKVLCKYELPHSGLVTTAPYLPKFDYDRFAVHQFMCTLGGQEQLGRPYLHGQRTRF